MRAVGKSNLKSKCQWMLANPNLLAKWKTAANSTPNKQNAGLCQLLMAPVPMALAAIAIVTASNPPSSRSLV